MEGSTGIPQITGNVPNVYRNLNAPYPTCAFMRHLSVITRRDFTPSKTAFSVRARDQHIVKSMSSRPLFMG